MATETSRKTHFFQDNSGKSFKNGAAGKVANTLCEANYKAEGLLTTATASEVTCASCVRRLTAEARQQPFQETRLERKPLQPQKSKAFARLRSSLFDPVVLAAFLGLIGAGIGAVYTNNRDHNFETMRAKCERAFAFLQDEAVNSTLEKDDAFYQMQFGIAVRCSRSAE